MCNQGGAKVTTHTRDQSRRCQSHHTHKRDQSRRCQSHHTHKRDHPTLTLASCQSCCCLLILHLAFHFWLASWRCTSYCSPLEGWFNPTRPGGRGRREREVRRKERGRGKRGGGRRGERGRRGEGGRRGKRGGEGERRRKEREEGKGRGERRGKEEGRGGVWVKKVISCLVPRPSISPLMWTVKTPNLVSSSSSMSHKSYGKDGEEVRVVGGDTMQRAGHAYRTNTPMTSL